MLFFCPFARVHRRTAVIRAEPKHNQNNVLLPPNACRLINFGFRSVIICSHPTWFWTDWWRFIREWVTGLQINNTSNVTPVFIWTNFCVFYCRIISHITDNHGRWAEFLSSTIFYGFIRRTLTIVLWSQSLEWKRDGEIVDVRGITILQEEPHRQMENLTFTHTYTWDGAVLLEHCAN